MRENEKPPASGQSVTLSAVPFPPQAVLSQALGVQGMVKKERCVYMVGQTRVHVDRVEGLGDFMELEVENSVVAQGRPIRLPRTRGRNGLCTWLL